MPSAAGSGNARQGGPGPPGWRAGPFYGAGGAGTRARKGPSIRRLCVRIDTGLTREVARAGTFLQMQKKCGPGVREVIRSRRRGRAQPQGKR